MIEFQPETNTTPEVAELLKQLEQTYSDRKKHVERSGQIDFYRLKYAYAFVNDMLCKVRVLDYCVHHQRYAAMVIEPGLLSAPLYFCKSELFPTRIDALNRQYERSQNIANAWKLRLEIERVAEKADVTIEGETFCTT